MAAEPDQGTVNADDRDAEIRHLRYEQPVDGIAMDQRQRAGALSLKHDDRQLLKARSLDMASSIQAAKRVTSTSTLRSAAASAIASTRRVVPASR